MGENIEPKKDKIYRAVSDDELVPAVLVEQPVEQINPGIDWLSVRGCVFCGGIHVLGHVCPGINSEDVLVIQPFLISFFQRFRSLLFGFVLDETETKKEEESLLCIMILLRFSSLPSDLLFD